MQACETCRMLKSKACQFVGLHILATRLTHSSATASDPFVVDVVAMAIHAGGAIEATALQRANCW